MKKVLFVCHGNICRSPMAEFILKSLTDELYCESRATSLEEIGNDLYPPVKDCLRRHSVPFTHHQAKRITQADYDNFDYIYVMDEYNLRNIKYVIADDNHKVRKLLKEDIEDPWYTGDFEKVYEEIKLGVTHLLNDLL